MNKLFCLGYPSPIGGASTELWHTLKLWRSARFEVHLIPTWGQPSREWREKCDSIGCETHVVSGPKREELEKIPGLAGGVVVSFCNDMFLQEAALFRILGCKIVWSGCMNWLFDQEKRHYALFGPFDAYHCQSRFQVEKLGPILAQYGVKKRQIHLVRGAFDPTEFPFAPRLRGEGDAFRIGRLSRGSIDKFSTNTWRIVGRVNCPKLTYRVMGWTDDVRRQIGDPPPWAETLSPCAMRSLDFFRSLDAYCQINGEANENWPRAGLEAMAAGVPVVVEARGGWSEMIEHRKTGFVCQSDAEIAHWLAALAWDEDLRISIAEQARESLVKKLAEPKKILAGWKKIFEQAITEKPPCKSKSSPTTCPTIPARRLTCNVRSSRDAGLRSSKRSCRSPGPSP